MQTWRKGLAVVYGNITLYALCYMMQQPVLPEVVKGLVVGEDAKIAWARYQTVFAVVQLLGGLASGVLSDHFGAKWLLLLSFVASAAGYYLQASATSMMLLYLSCLPSTLQHAFMGANAYVTDVTAEEERAQMLGYVQLFYSIGMVVGPTLGGYLGSTDVTTGAWLAVVGSLLSAALIVPLENTASIRNKDRPLDGQSAMLLLKVVRAPGVATLVVAKFFGALAMLSWQTTMAMVMREEFGFGPQDQGYLMGFVGLSSAVIIGSRVIGKVSTLFEDTTIIIVSGMADAAVMLVYPMLLSANLFSLLPVLFVKTVAVIFARTTSTALFTKLIPPSTTGTVIGLDAGISSGVRIIAPSLGGYVYAAYGLPGLSSMCCACMVVMACVISLLPSAKKRR